MAGGAAYQAAQLQNRQTAAIATASAAVQRQLTTVQDKVSHIGLSAGLIKKQQELSAKYGIVTFDIEGNISTVPNVIDPSVILTTGTGGKSEAVFLKSVMAIQDSQAAAAVTIPQVEQQTQSFIQDIQANVTPLLESDFTPNQVSQITAIDNQIRAAQHQQQLDKATDTGNGMSVDATNDFISQSNAITNLENQRTNLVQSFRFGNPIKQQLTLLLQTLDSLVSQTTVTAKLKQQITDTTNQINDLFQKAKDNNVTLSQSQINAARGLIEQGQFILQSPIADTQTNTNALTDVVGNFLNIAKPLSDAFNAIFNPSEDDLVQMIVKQINAQKRAAAQLKGALG